MRITNSMLTSNMLMNMNKNLTKLDKLENIFATGKKIQFPSDNPIIAGKSLKLRTNLYENKQYQDNIGDANAWMSITEKAIGNISEITGRIRDLCVQGASSSLSKADREKIIEEIKQLREQIVQEANASNGGRYIFSGHKTNKKLIFDSEVIQPTRIVDQFQVSDINKLYENTNYSYKLPYSDIKDTITLNIGSEEYTVGGVNYNIVLKSNKEADAYTPPAPTAVPQKTVHMIIETGELVFEESHYASITDPINVEYEKDRFKSGDLNPVHYFDTVERITVGGSVGALDASNQLQLPYQNIKEDSIDGLSIGGVPVATANIIYANSGDTVALGPDDVRVDMDTGIITAGTNYNTTDSVDLNFYDKINKIEAENIEYEVSINTKMTINTQGNEVITEDLIKDIDMLISNAIRLDQDYLSKVFGNMLTKIDYHDKVILKNQASIGSKMNRLELIQSRLENDNINYTQLMSDNEDADLAETYTRLNTQSIVYQASLAASAKIMQQSLIDFLR